jgi:hypothetical protein
MKFNKYRSFKNLAFIWAFEEIFALEHLNDEKLFLFRELSKNYENAWPCKTIT